MKIYMVENENGPPTRLTRSMINTGLGHVKAKLRRMSVGRYDYSKKEYTYTKIADRYNVVEYELVPVKRTSASDMYERMLRRDAFEKEFGPSLGKLLSKLDEEGTIADYTWCVAILPRDIEPGLVARINAGLKKMQCIREQNFITNNKGTWVFKDKRHAMSTKLMIGKAVKTIDLTDYIEKTFES
jgi:hypothetical protein